MDAVVDFAFGYAPQVLKRMHLTHRDPRTGIADHGLLLHRMVNDHFVFRLGLTFLKPMRASLVDDDGVVDNIAMPLQLELMFDYHAAVELEERDSQLSMARLAYKDAIANLSWALMAFYSTNVPLAVECDSPAEPWTHRQIRATAALNEAWAGFVTMRSAYDELINSWRSDFV